MVRPIALDNAATTPPLRVVQATVDRFLDWYASVHRGAGFKSRLSTQVYEDCRAVVADFVGADLSRQHVLFTRSTTESLNVAAEAIPFEPGDIVAASILEHHSNLLPWRRRAAVSLIEIDEQGRLDLRSLERILVEGRGRVRVVALTAASNVTGYRTPIHEAARLAHVHGARICVDAAQLVAHRALDMGAPDDPGHLDLVAFSGHKLFAPYGSGVLVGPAALLDAAEPRLIGGGTVSRVSHDDHQLLGGPDRHEAGSPNVVGAVAIATAIAAVRAIGLPAMESHEHALTRRLLIGLARIPGVRVLGDPSPDATDRGPVVSLVVDGRAQSGVTAALSAEWGIGVRDGGFCAHPYVAALLAAAGASAQATGTTQGGQRSAAIRLSMAPFNEATEIDRTLEALDAIARGRLRLAYRQDARTGTIVPLDWQPDLAHAFVIPGLRARA